MSYTIHAIRHTACSELAQRTVRPEIQRVYGHRARGFTLVEIMVAAAIVAAMAMIAVPNLQQWTVNQRVKSTGRQVANAFTLARGEAIRTGDLHIVFVQEDTMGSNLTDDDGTVVPVLVINDGRPGEANQNCRVDAGERVFVVYAERDVAWGVADATTNAPADSGSPDFAISGTWPVDRIRWVSHRWPSRFSTRPSSRSEVAVAKPRLC